MFFTGESFITEQSLIVGTVAPFDKSVAPWLALGNECVNELQAFGSFVKSGLALRLIGVLHGKGHMIIGKDQIERRQASDGFFQKSSKGFALEVRMYLTVLYSGTHVDDTDFVRKAFAPFDRRELLPVHLGTVPPYV